MTEVKVFRINGKIRKPNFRINFQKEMRALKPEEAIEEVYKILGSKHKAKHFQIIIEKIEEIETKENVILNSKKEMMQVRN